MDVWKYARSLSVYTSAEKVTVGSWSWTYAWTGSSMSMSFLSRGESQRDSVCLEVVVCRADTAYNMSYHAYTHPPLDHYVRV